MYMLYFLINFLFSFLLLKFPEATEFFISYHYLINIFIKATLTLFSIQLILFLVFLYYFVFGVSLVQTHLGLFF